ncbi:MAG: sugar ABC transporter ATP-binding protein [Proteobacteria bacterium]|nr:sugar ABC transporter ATP-binding protein [Pseudomonadota bacterium]
MTAIAPGSEAPRDPILRVTGLTKEYHDFAALRDVSFDIRRGSIHGLLGENGAGKSTLVGLIAGMRVPTRGRILLDGREVQGLDVKAAEQAGVFLVTQEPMIVGQITVAENLLLGHWPQQGGVINWKELRRQARRMLEGTDIDPEALAENLSAVNRRKLNILRALFSGGRLIILDEPTAALTVDDRTVLFDFMRKLREQGITFVFISHYNEEILDICDAVTVLRNGRLAGSSDDISTMNSARLSELVLGRDLQLFERRTAGVAAPTEAGFRVRGVKAPLVDIVEFAIRPGEVVGFAGLPGSGAKEFAQTLFGLNPAETGVMRLATDGGETPLPPGPPEALARGIAYLSDDRRRDGLVASLSIGDNLSLSSLPVLSRLGFVKRRAEAGLIRRYFREMGVKAPDPAVSIDTLSGGNQQKVCLGRLLATKPSVLILDEPTRGIDVGVKEDVHRMVDKLTQEGLSVIVVTADLGEMSRVVDRVCIFSGGTIVETLHAPDITKERLLKAAFNRRDARALA